MGSPALGEGQGTRVEAEGSMGAAAAMGPRNPLTFPQDPCSTRCCSHLSECPAHVHILLPAFAFHAGSSSVVSSFVGESTPSGSGAVSMAVGVVSFFTQTHSYWALGVPWGSVLNAVPKGSMGGQWVLGSRWHSLILKVLFLGCH